jgi:hypothetical protein
MQKGLNFQKEENNYELVAKSNGHGYSLKSREKGKWVHNRGHRHYELVTLKMGKNRSEIATVQAAIPYQPSEGYQPLHLKNLRRGCKLFLEEKFPGFRRNLEFFKK